MTNTYYYTIVLTVMSHNFYQNCINFCMVKNIKLMVFHYDNNRRRSKSTRDAKFELGG